MSVAILIGLLCVADELAAKDKPEASDAKIKVLVGVIIFCILYDIASVLS